MNGVSRKEEKTGEESKSEGIENLPLDLKKYKASP